MVMECNTFGNRMDLKEEFNCHDLNGSRYYNNDGLNMI